MTRTAPLRPKSMPAKHPRIAHFMPYLKGDSLYAIVLAYTLGFRFIDMNLACTKDGFAVIIHWPRLVKNGFKWRATGKRDRRGREIRVRASNRFLIHEHTLDEVLSFRSAKRGGRRPRLPREAMKVAEARGLIICFEAKGSPGFQRVAVWERLAADAIATGAVVVVMTLQNIGGNHAAFIRLQLAAAHGFAVALLPRMKRPLDWHTNWVPIGVKQWGRWR